MGEVKGRIMSEALELVERMVQALNNHVIEGQEEFWSEDTW